MIMNDKRKALGKGLESLLPARPGAGAGTAAATAGVAPVASTGEAVRDIRINDLDRSPWQTRDLFSPESVEELAASIKAQGLVQPVVVRQIPNGRYQLIAGERRVAACRLLGRETVPAIVRRVSDEQAAEMTVIENLMREDLNPIEQAWAFEKLSSQFGLTQEEIAAKTGKDRATIGNYLRILKLPGNLHKALAEGQLTMGHVKPLMTLDPGIMLAAANTIIKRSMSVRQTEKYIQGLLMPKPQVRPADREMDPNVKAAEEQLKQRLGCQVEIEDHSGRGTITIRYATLEDFDRVVEALGLNG